MVYERILPWYEGTSEARLVMFSRHTIIRTANMKFETAELGHVQKRSLTEDERAKATSS